MKLIELLNMNDFDDVTLIDVTEIVDIDYYSSRKPNDFEIYGENSDSCEDTITRMVMEAQ